MHRRGGLRTRRNRAPLVLAVALAALLAGACSDDSTPEASPPGASPSGAATSVAPGQGGGTTGADVATSSTLEGEQSPTSAAPPPTGPPPDGTKAGACAALPAVPAGAADVDTDRGDFDGDHALDSLTAYKLGATWKLRVGLTTGGGAEVDVPGVTGEAGLTPLGGVDLGGGPGAEPFAVVGQGAATATIAVFHLQGCTLSRVNGPTGAPSEFAVGGTVLNGSGLRCEQAGDQVHLLVLQATSQDGTTFTATAQPLVLQGDALVGAGDVRSTSLTAPGDNGPLGAYFRITCGGVAEGS
jgi:hypothetical protein